MSFWKLVGAIVVAILCLTLGLPVLGFMLSLAIVSPALIASLGVLIVIMLTVEFFSRKK